MKLRIVRQLAPGNLVRVGPNGKKRAERRDGVNHLAAHLLDLKVLDRPNTSPVGGIHSGALDPITPDVRVSGSPCSLGRFHDDVLHCQSHLNEDRQLRTAQTSCPGVDRYSVRGGRNSLRSLSLAVEQVATRHQGNWAKGWVTKP